VGIGGGSRWGFGSGRRAEALRLIVVVAVAAGAVALLTQGGHGSKASATHASQLSTQGGSPLGSAATPAGSAGVTGSATLPTQAGHVTVAGGPAVTRSLQHGSMVVVIDQPSNSLFAEQNRSITRGAAVAVDQLNAAGGLTGHVHIRLVPQSLDGLSAAAVQSRLHSEAAAALVLPCDADSQLNLAAGASQDGTLMFAPCNPDATAGKRYPTYWPVGMAATDEAAGLTSFMYTLGYRDVFVVSAPGSRYVELLTSDFQSAAKARGIQVAGNASVATTTTDFTALAQAIESVHPKPSAIFTALPPPLVNRMAAGLQAQGVGATVLGSTAMDTPLTLSANTKALENATFTSYGFPRLSASAARFAADYRRQFGHEVIGSFPGLGFETIRLIEAAAKKAGSAEPSAIQQALAGGLTLRGIALANRAYEPGGNHNPVGEVAISKVSAGSLLPLIVTSPTAAPTP
jgi:branched-chain amino acid transport system substrate-binding protein